jgi:hypothetical protein
MLWYPPGRQSVVSTPNSNPDLVGSVPAAESRQGQPPVTQPDLARVA